MDIFEAALERVRQFRATFNDDDVVDEESGLMADDLTQLIQAVDAFGADAVAQDPRSAAEPE